MKIEELKHNHSLTDLLKILLFTILMLAPIGMVATRCLYVIANKNAYQSYSGENSNNFEDTLISSYDELINGDTYVFNSANLQTTNSSAKIIGISNVKIIIPSSIDTFNETLLQAESFTTTYYSNIAYLVPKINGVSQTGLDMSVRSIMFSFTLTGEGHQNTNTYTDSWSTLIYKRTYNDNYMLDNVFEYSVSQLEESNLFNWTENTAIYSGINAMNVQLGINSPAITIVLTYWLILTCIYVIIDIVLKLFTYITHMIGSRKA